MGAPVASPLMSLVLFNVCYCCQECISRETLLVTFEAQPG